MSSAPAPVSRPLDRATLLDWFDRNRARSRALFDLIRPDDYLRRPIALSNPIVFYEGHLPAFNVIVFVRRGLEQPGVDERLELLFARGIDPEDEQSATPRGNPLTWPSRDEVLAYADRADARIRRRSPRRGSTCPATPCSIGRKASTRCSSTRRCIRRRCSTCGIG